MKSGWAYHLLFAVGLVALTALGAWWLIFFQRAVDAQHAARLAELRTAATAMALRIGYGHLPAALGQIQGAAAPVEVVKATDHADDGYLALALPGHPDIGVRPLPDVLAAVETQAHRRWLMVVGEGSFLFLLIALCSFMLYRLVSEERRHRARLEGFLSTVSHEMKTPLTGIKSLLQTLAAGRIPPDEMSRLYGLGLRETERLEHLIENVLVSGRLRLDAHDLQVGPVELKTLLERFVSHRRRYLVDRPDAIALRWEIDDGLVYAQADRDALLAILENLADNSFKYGGEQPRVVLRARRDGGRLLVAVEDDGIGFPPERAASLFVPFHRGHGDDRNPVQHGAGLGLAIASTLAKKMAGDLFACSEGLNRGSSFTIALREAADERSGTTGGG